MGRRRARKSKRQNPVTSTGAAALFSHLPHDMSSPPPPPHLPVPALPTLPTVVDRINYYLIRYHHHKPFLVRQTSNDTVDVFGRDPYHQGQEELVYINRGQSGEGNRIEPIGDLYTKLLYHFPVKKCVLNRRGKDEDLETYVRGSSILLVTSESPRCVILYGNQVMAFNCPESVPVDEKNFFAPMLWEGLSYPYFHSDQQIFLLFTTPSIFVLDMAAFPDMPRPDTPVAMLHWFFNESYTLYVNARNRFATLPQIPKSTIPVVNSGVKVAPVTKPKTKQTKTKTKG